MIKRKKVFYSPKGMLKAAKNYFSARSKLSLKTILKKESITSISSANRSAVEIEKKYSESANIDSSDKFALERLFNSDLGVSFNSQHYTALYQDIKMSLVDPKTHFLKLGFFEGRTSSIYFDPKWYLANNVDVSCSNELPLKHYALFGLSELRSPNEYFDPKWYYQNYPDIAATSIDPLFHYIKHGSLEGRRPGPLFDPNFYRSSNPDLMIGEIEPLEHYLLNGRREGRLPLPSPNGQGANTRINFGLIIFLEDKNEISKTLISISENSERIHEIIIFVVGRVLFGRDADYLKNKYDLQNIRVEIIAVENKYQALCIGAEKLSTTYIAAVDSGDSILPGAFERIFRHINDNDSDIVYSDEQQFIDNQLKLFLKPSWSPELLTSYNYFGRLTVLKRSVAILCLPAADSGAAAEWDMYLRVADHSDSIHRIPEVLCRRSHTSDLGRPKPKLIEAFEYRNVLNNYWRKRVEDPKVTTKKDGTLRVTWEIKAPPLVSIIIPNKNKLSLLRMTIEGIISKTNYSNIEIIIVDNMSTDKDLLDYYAHVVNEYPIKLVQFDENFNYSAACNLGASQANGDLFLFLNNDIEVVNKDWLSELVRYASRPGVGIVGTMLVYPSGELQHAGVVVGMHICGLIFRSAPIDSWGIFGSPSTPRNYLAIMGACQLVRREVFERVCGFDETYRISNSDVALCAQAWRAGYRTAYAPEAKLIHHEGATRGKTNPLEDLHRTAVDLSRIGVQDDPYFHPLLSPDHGIPTLKNPSDLTSEESFNAYLKHVQTINPIAGDLDLYDNGSIAEISNLPLNRIIWGPKHPHTINSEIGAIRWCIDLFRSRDDVRKQFGDLFSGKDQVKFIDWISINSKTFCLHKEIIDIIKAALSRNWSGRILTVYTSQSDIRGSYPLGFTSAGSRGLLVYLLQNTAKYKLSLEEIWWTFLHFDRNPVDALYISYKVNQEWQRIHPAGMTVFGSEEFCRWLKLNYKFDREWLIASSWDQYGTDGDQIIIAYNFFAGWKYKFPNALKSRENLFEMLEWLENSNGVISTHGKDWIKSKNFELVSNEVLRQGINIIGHFSYPSGLRTSALSIVQSLASVGWGTSLRNLPVELFQNEFTTMPELGTEKYDITIIHLQPEPYFNQAYSRSGLLERNPKTYRIGYWYWELDEIPDDWIDQISLCNEIWTATSFVANALKKKFDIPVHTLMPGLKTLNFEKRDRSYFGIPNNKFVFLFMFHMTSIMERKNPSALIEAFKIAAAENENAMLVIKTSFGSSNKKNLEYLSSLADIDNIKIIDEIYDQNDTTAIMECCDCYVSLHRSEGYGLTIAEAMLLGKPVIVTGYSGNMDFTTEDNCFIVECKIVPIEFDIPPYSKGMQWAEPSVRHAAQRMAEVLNDRAAAKSKGERGKEDIEKFLSFDNAGRRMSSRLQYILDHEIKITDL